MRFLLFLVLVATGVAFALLQVFLGSYTALTQESPLARIEMSELAPQRYEMDVHFQSGVRESYRLAGDYFMLEAEVLTMKNWATVLGEEPRARLTKLRGLYHAIIEGDFRDCLQGNQFDDPEPCRTDYDVSDAQYQSDIARVNTWAAKFGAWFVNTSDAEREPFYSAAGVTLAPGVVWICMTEDALVARPGDGGCGT